MRALIVLIVAACVALLLCIVASLNPVWAHRTCMQTVMSVTTANAAFDVCLPLLPSGQ